MYFGANEIMERKNLLLITDRLMCRKMSGIPVIYMSRKAISERGVQVLPCLRACVFHVFFLEEGNEFLARILSFSILYFSFLLPSQGQTLIYLSFCALSLPLLPLSLSS